jgi:hypothetical protein
MRYMILVYLEEKKWLALSPEQQQAEMAKCGPHSERLKEAGKMLDGAPLHPTTMATTLRNRGGKRLVTDGPFAETREQLGGYTLIDADNLDEAIEIAGGFLGDADYVTLEVRPVLELPKPA